MRGAFTGCPPEETTILSQPSVQPAKQYAPVSPEPQKPKTSKKTGLIIGRVAGTIVLIVAVVLIVVFAGKGKDDKPANAESNSNAAVSDVQNTDKQDETKKPASNTPLSRDEVVIAYLKALANYDIVEAKKYTLDFSEEVYKLSTNYGLNLNEEYENITNDLPKDFDEEVKINSVQELYAALENRSKKEINKSFPDYFPAAQKFDPKIKSATKMDLADKEVKDDILSDIIYSSDIFNLISEGYDELYAEYYIDNFIKYEDITEAYEIEVVDKSGAFWESDDATYFTVIKYKDNWLVLDDPIEMFNKGIVEDDGTSKWIP